MTVKTAVATAEPAVSDAVLSTLVAAVKEDPADVVADVKARVATSRSDPNNCMMGGWTA